MTYGKDKIYILKSKGGVLALATEDKTIFDKVIRKCEMDKTPIQLAYSGVLGMEYIVL